MGASRPSSQKVSDTFEIVSRSAEATEQFGERLGQRLTAGDVVALVGELGSGKTTLIRGLARGLGIDPALVKSPTFILLREYPGPIPLIHIDGYRLDGTSGAVVWEDPDWLFSPTKVTVIEWAERFVAWLPEEYVEAQLEHKTTNQRALRFLSHGPRSAQLVSALTQTTSHDPARD